MVDRRRWLQAAASSTAWLAGIGGGPVALAATPPLTDFTATRPSTEARQVVDWIRHSGDAQGRPYAVVDKRKAHIYIFDAGGQLAGHSSVLLGSTFGDHIVPGVGARAQDGTIREDERTTPAGRFEAGPGVNVSGEHVVWVDYASAFAIHRLRPGFSYGPRVQRLASAAPGAKRVSWGCVVVPVAFYKSVVEKVLGKTRSVVYVMPETRPVGALLQAMDQR
jgi:hypothetical protein